MKHILSGLLVAAATTLCAGSLAAQTTTQEAVLGDSGNATYPVQVRGGNGVLYNCRAGLVQTADGRSARECIRVDGDGGALFDSGTGIATAAPVLGIVLVAVAVSGGGDNDSSTTTTASGGTVSQSDSRLKSDITRVGTTSHGLALYHFRYTGGAQVYEGVMAQDVQKIMPEAVVMMENGFLGVKYGLLGLEMRAVK